MRMPLDTRPASAPGRGRPLDLAAHRRTHPATTGRAPRRRPAPTLGTPRRPRPPHPSKSPPRHSEHPRHDRPAGPSTQTQPSRSRTPARLLQPAARTPRPRRQNRQARPQHHRPPAADGLRSSSAGEPVQEAPPPALSRLGRAHHRMPSVLSSACVRGAPARSRNRRRCRRSKQVRRCTQAMPKGGAGRALAGRLRGDVARRDARRWSQSPSRASSGSCSPRSRSRSRCAVVQR